EPRIELVASGLAHDGQGLPGGVVEGAAGPALGQVEIHLAAQALRQLAVDEAGQLAPNGLAAVHETPLPWTGRRAHRIHRGIDFPQQRREFMSYLERAALDEDAFPPFRQIRETFGFLPNFFRAQTLRADLVEPQMNFIGSIMVGEGALSRRQKEYVVLTP